MADASKRRSKSSKKATPETSIVKAELEFIENSCRTFCGPAYQHMTGYLLGPRDWVDFRNWIQCIGKLQDDNDQHIIIVKDNTLIRFANMEPICTFPSCFSTEGTSKNEETRCDKHVGNIKIAVTELVFYEGNMKVGVDHVPIMYVLDDPAVESLDDRRPITEEYKNANLLMDTVRRLKEKDLPRSAALLAKPKGTVPMRRCWVFDFNDIDSAYMKLSMIAMAASEVSVAYSGSKEVLPSGTFQGKHLTLVTAFIPGDFSYTQRREMGAEQFEAFGLRIFTEQRSSTDQMRAMMHCLHHVFSFDDSGTTESDDD